MTREKETRGFTNFGFSTILLSFVMICVVTFSVLSLISAYSDYKLSQKVANKNQNYYAASECAYEKLATIDQILIENYLSTPDESSYYSGIENEISEYGMLNVTSSGYYLYFKEPISESNYLSIKLFLHYPKENADSFYEILEWQSVYERDFPEEEPLNLLN